MMAHHQPRQQRHTTMFISLFVQFWLLARIFMNIGELSPQPDIGQLRDPVFSLPLAITTASTDFVSRKLLLGLCNSLRSGLSSRTISKTRSGSRTVLIILTFMLILSGDIELNPGPGLGSIFPCGYCEIAVNWSQRALCCDKCEIWYHKSCLEMCTQEFQHLENHSDLSYTCGRCHHMNHASNLYHSYEISTSNYYEPLSRISHTSASHSGLQGDDQCDTLFTPHSFSSPKDTQRKARAASIRSSVTSPTSMTSSSAASHDKTNALPHKSNNLRSLVINSNSIAGKVADLETLVEYTDPDVILMCETKLDKTVMTSEFMRKELGYKVYRRDRKLGGGGVLIAIKEQYPSVKVNLTDVDGEIVWAEVTIKGKRKLFIAAFYRPPDHLTTQLDELDKSLKQITARTKNNQNSVIIIGGDFNTGDIDWETLTIDPKTSKRTVHNKVLDILADHGLAQMQREPTREDSVLDLFITNRPGLTKNMSTIPGMSDHLIVVADINIQPMRNRKPPRNINQYSKADWNTIREETVRFGESFLQEISTNSVQHNWETLKHHLAEAMSKHIPTKRTNNRSSIPWLTQSIKRLIRKKQRCYNKAKKSGNTTAWSKFKVVQKQTQKALRSARLFYINNILQDSLKEKNPKPFWKYVKSQMQDNVGVAPLKSNGTLHNDSKTKAQLLNNQFQSVFTNEDKSNIPKLSGQKTPSIGQLTVTAPGVAKLLSKLEPNKAAGPDNIPSRLLKELANELSPLLAAVFSQSLTSGHIPSDWSTAHVAPIFKKGNHNQAENYRPVSLTSICCKIFEHIISRHILDHLDRFKSLTHLQHGFRSAHSCESQLLITVQDLMKTRDSNTQLDVAILDFSKAFDTVPHERLLNKLEHYGIEGEIHTWIRSFLTSRKQCVVVDGVQSDWADVKSGVPQGTVLGPLLFLLHINDLPSAVSSKVRMFADDCLLYREIKSPEDQLMLQKDLDALVVWSETWGMRFNPSKCNILRICKSGKPHEKFYSISNQILTQVKEAKYLGVTITEDLTWSSHATNITNRANSTLGFLRRNLRSCPEKLRETAYVALVRSVLEYCCPVWDPYLKKDVNMIEQVQRRAARFVKSKYRWDDGSVTAMIKELGWMDLENRRRDLRLTLLYKIVNSKVAVPADDILIPADSRTRASHQHKFRQITTKTQQYKHSFYPNTIVSWNKLPAEVVESPTIPTFKERLKKSTQGF